MENKFIAVSDEEISNIKKNKLIYSIIKYEKLSPELQDELRPRYMRLLNLHDGNVNSNSFEETKQFLDHEKDSIEEMKEMNQPIIDMYTEQIIKNLKQNMNEYKDDLVKCAKLFEYVSKIMTYDEDGVMYDSVIPFAGDYQITSFYKGVPISNDYPGLLVTRCGGSNDISNLMVYLGNVFGLNIKTILCGHDGKPYSINTFEYNGQISYMDVTSVIQKRKSIKQACLVDRDTLVENDSYYGIKEAGHKFSFSIKQGGSGIDKVISRERNHLLEISKDSILYLDETGKKISSIS